MKCADALNKEFGMGVTVAQVDRHYRDFKEKWNIVEKALNNSGNGFDVTRCKVTISESEKAKLNAVDIPSDDSDTLPSAKRPKTSPGSAEGGENSSSSTPRSGANRPRPKGMKSPAKKPSKLKSRLSEATERLEAMPLRTEDKINVGVYLARPECEDLVVVYGGANM
ncbi:hypothetical protein EJB05_36813 [Eragrostis curvula]|uniref:Myb/SANT-like domain-containing protein n=1 Tax=Eragrostis curvula TaxID=38414 RepID=A0A5J9UA49_9POAL|nr:hypothetical protein EJB05_36813 [Eragrostis curvula]